MQRIVQQGRANWFLVVVPPLVFFALLAARTAVWEVEGRGLEAALIADACLTVPLLYALCYGRSLRWPHLAVRMLGLACLGIYLLGYIVPPAAQSLLPKFSFARMLGLAVLVVVEIRLLIAVARLIFNADVTQEQLQESTGVPPLVAKLLLLEARFWKAVLRLIRRS